MKYTGIAAQYTHASFSVVSGSGFPFRIQMVKSVYILSLVTNADAWCLVHVKLQSIEQPPIYLKLRFYNAIFSLGQFHFSVVTILVENRKLQWILFGFAYLFTGMVLISCNCNEMQLKWISSPASDKIGIFCWFSSIMFHLNERFCVTLSASPKHCMAHTAVMGNDCGYNSEHTAGLRLWHAQQSYTVVYLTNVRTNESNEIK